MYIPELYNIIYSKVEERANSYNREVDVRIIARIIHRMMKIEKSKVPTIIQELCYFGLIEKCNCKKVKLLRLNGVGKKDSFSWLEK